MAYQFVWNSLAERSDVLNQHPRSLRIKGRQRQTDFMTVFSQHSIEIRVSYHETDGQGRVHHANYLNYFEQGRVELLRAAGASYKDFEAAGRMLVVTEMNVRYLLPAEFDDCLRLTTRVLSSRGARIRHNYELYRGDMILVSADSTIACIDRQGRPTRLPPDWQQGRV